MFHENVDFCFEIIQSCPNGVGVSRIAHVSIAIAQKSSFYFFPSVLFDRCFLHGETQTALRRSGVFVFHKQSSRNLVFCYIFLCLFLFPSPFPLAKKNVPLKIALRPARAPLMWRNGANRASIRFPRESETPCDLIELGQARLS